MRLRQVECDAPIGSIWQHHKGGTYIVDGYCMIESTWEVGILYKTDPPTGELVIARPARHFLDGRFRRINTISVGEFGAVSDNES